MSDSSLEERLGFHFRDSSLLAVALTHRSAANEGLTTTAGDNERLEFLGDAILGAVVSDALYRAFPDAPEGSLTNMRAELVCQSGLASWARQIELGPHVVLGRGEEQRGGRDRDALLASCFEALIGAVFLDQGYKAAQELVAPLVAEALPLLSPSPRARDAKSELQYRLQARYGVLPTYQVVGVEGPEHRPVFTIEVWAGEGILATGVGPSKQSAEQEAAREALRAMSGE